MNHKLSRWLTFGFFCAAMPLASGAGEAALPDGLYAKMLTTKGEIVLALEFEKTPMTVTNFVGLAEGKIKNTRKNAGEPYYDGLKFHRVFPGFMAQGGCPMGNGRGGPGYQFADEFDPSLRHSGPGILSMANAGPGTNGSQFFITYESTPHLNNKHSVFGKVVSGMDVLKSLTPVDPENPVPGVIPDVIKTVTIVRVGEKAKAFQATQESFDKLQSTAKDRVAEKLKSMKSDTENLIKKKWPTVKQTSTGLYYVVNKAGAGEKPKKGANVTAHYTGTLLSNGQKFDSSVDRGQPFEFSVGMGQVISGWDQAFLDMAKGEKRTIILPPDLGYGERGAGGVIPPNAYLVFDVELIDFQ